MVPTVHLHVVGVAERQVAVLEWVDAGHFGIVLGVGEVGALVGGDIDSSWVVCSLDGGQVSLSLGRFGEDFVF